MIRCKAEKKYIIQLFKNILASLVTMFTPKSCNQFYNQEKTNTQSKETKNAQSLCIIHW